ncbi:hypothetical protein NDU88_003014 [Pleurodeles waltl]|uniref:C2 domain-containing protein n=2 Tax=Pleurodeles waltl TaxID=8319 RepID=A0AAV7TMB1_PLEWA|nr:hypothetical protein NDU88_003014 [Pleurodeles waltl]
MRVTLESSSKALSFPGLGAEGIMLGTYRLSSDTQSKGTLPYVLTPDRIPEFCIPPQLTSQLKKPDAPCHHRSTPNIRSSVAKAGESQKSAEALSFPQKHIIQIESADDIPCDVSCSDDESTNADPQSQAALSLPHLPKAHTSYGFCTLLESPNTRRKESIFHNDPWGSPALPCLLPRSRSSTYCKGVSAPILHVSSMTGRLPPQDMCVRRSCMCDSDTASSTESSPFSSPMLNRPVPRSNSLFKAFSQERLFCKAFKVNSRTSASRNNSVSTDEGSSTDNSPNVTRRASEGLMEPLPSLACSFSPLPLDLMYRRERFVRENAVFLDRGGVLRISGEYCPENERLQVRLISAEGLYETSIEPKSINCCVSLSLLPGKAQKQRSTIIRMSRNPIFNEDFFFDGIREEDLCNRSLRIKAVNKVSSLKRDCVLGRSELCLASILPI